MFALPLPLSVLLLLALHLAASGALDLPPLAHVPGLFDALDVAELVATRAHRRQLDHADDVFGGSTRLHTDLTLDDRVALIHVDGIRVAIATNDNNTSHLCSRIRVADAAARDDLHAPGAILIGSGDQFAHCCPAEAAAAQSDTMASMDGMRATLRVCTRVVRQLRPVAAADDGLLFDVVLGDVNPWSLVGSLEVDFRHVPGNRSLAEARAEARKRSYDWIDLTEARRFTAFNWNYDAAAGASKGPINLISADRQSRSTLARVFSRTASCADCHAYLGVGVELNLKVARSWWGFPELQALRVVVFGEVSAAAVLRVALPISASIDVEHRLLRDDIRLPGIVIPAGPLAFQLNPSLRPSLVGGVVSNLDTQIDLGATAKLTIRCGVQYLNDGTGTQGISDVVSELNLVNDWNNALASITATTVAFRIGVRASLNVGIALGLSAAALAGNRGVEFTSAGINLTPAAVLSISSNRSCGGLNHFYKLERQVTVDAQLDAITIKAEVFGYEWEQTIGIGGALPWQSPALHVITPGVPPRCAACAGCVIAGAPRVRRTAVPAVQSKKIDPPKVAFTARAPALVVTASVDGRAAATTATLGRARIVVGWRLEGGGASPAQVRVAATVRRNAQETGSAATDVTGTAALAWSPASVTIDTTRRVPLRVATGNEIRFTVYDAATERIFGSSQWIRVTLDAAALGAGAPAWQYGAWTQCSVTCGPNAVRTRTAICVAANGAMAAAAGCGTLSQTLTRGRCPGAPTTCPTRPLVMAQPAFGASVASSGGKRRAPTSSYTATLPLAIGGGLLTSPIDVFVCSALVELQCEVDLLAIDRRCLLAKSLEPSATGYANDSISIDVARFSTTPSFMQSRMFDNYATLSTVVRVVARVQNGTETLVGDQVLVTPPGEFSYAVTAALPATATVVTLRGSLGSLVLTAPVVVGQRYASIDLGDVLAIYLAPSPGGFDMIATNVSRFLDGVQTDTASFSSGRQGRDILLPTKIAGDPDGAKYISVLTIQPDTIVTEWIVNACAARQSKVIVRGSDRDAATNADATMRADAEEPLQLAPDGSPILPTGRPEGSAELVVFGEEDDGDDGTDGAANAKSVPQLLAILACLMLVIVSL
jgi:hypothetical protein